MVVVCVGVALGFYRSWKSDAPTRDLTTPQQARISRAPQYVDPSRHQSSAQPIRPSPDFNRSSSEPDGTSSRASQSRPQPGQPPRGPRSFRSGLGTHRVFLTRSHDISGLRVPRGFGRPRSFGAQDVQPVEEITISGGERSQDDLGDLCIVLQYEVSVSELPHGFTQVVVECAEGSSGASRYDGMVGSMRGRSGCDRGKVRSWRSFPEISDLPCAEIDWRSATRVKYSHH